MLSEIYSWTSPTHTRTRTHLVSKVDLRSCPVVSGSKSLHDRRVVDADLTVPTQGVLLRPDLIWADQVSDQPP